MPADASSQPPPFHSPLSPPPSPSQRPKPAPLRLHPVSASLTVPPHIPRPPYARPSFFRRDPRHSQHASQAIERKSPAAIAAMRRACRYAAYIRHYASQQLQAGRTTDEVDVAVHGECVRLGVYPSPLHYAGFPKSLCTSLNQCVCHGIPDARPLQPGDIVNCDVSVWVDGHHGDCSGTYVVGDGDAHALHLIHATREAVRHSIAACGSGVPFSRIGDICEAVAEAGQYAVVKEYCGHGIGRDFHMPPLVLHVRNDGRELMQPGMTFTIEPMLCEGKAECFVREDGWTVETRDGMRSAQWEETVLITETGVEVLTSWDGKELPVVTEQET